ncbi:DUF6916 family protein [Sphingomonas sp.]|uniref:DUF6916 family protein n=1 Tax=Sphingomonas sp. TaxID=28214 RepID=UPI002D157092|nr:hypothetical protein [Sphingomonas sp.]HWK34799.1 hypothetical protein [Sphingomonas sp.]
MRFYRPEDFTPLIGESLVIAGTEPAMALTLAAVRPIPHSPREGGGFALDLVGPRDPVIPQGTIGLIHGADEHVVFVVAVGSGPDGTDYEAIFT